MHPTQCPQCRAPLDLDPHWAPWCESCDWGIDPTPREEHDGPFERWWRKRLNRASALEHERLLARGLADGPAADRWVVLAAATVVHLTTLAFAVGVVLLALAPIWVPARVVGCLLGIAVLVLLRPRIRKDEVEGFVLSREAAPALWSLIEEVAATLGTRPPDRLEIDGDVNASWGRVGLRGRRVLTLGLPLWASLDGQAKVAVLGHEVGHEVNGDVERSWYVGWAVQTLEEWEALLIPHRPTLGAEDDGSRLLTVIQLVAIAALTPVLALLFGARVLLLTLAARSHQHAEHLADDHGAQLSGTAGALSAERALLGPDVLAFALDVALRRDPAASLWQVTRQHTASVPGHEKGRQLALARRTLQSIDAAHPPTFRRLEMVSTREETTPLIVLTPTREHTIDEEVRSAETWVAGALRRQREAG